ncbi:glycosyltransferase family protein 28, partial [Perilla frutescens var. frutescens]
MGEIDEISKSKRVVFVTVGTTSFDALVRAVDTMEVREALFRKGYTDLVIQMGRGSYVPSKSTGEDGSLSVDYFTFSSSIAEHLKSASLVISHAGSGSIFETLRLRKPLIVVVNEDLMDNHQSELAEELAERNHLFCARPQTLYETISAMDPNSLVPYQPVVSNMENKHVSEELGDWQLVHSPSSTISAKLINGDDDSSAFPPGNHEDLPICSPVYDPEPIHTPSPLAGGNDVKKWRRLHLGVVKTGILEVFGRFRNCVTCKVGLWSFAWVAGGVAAALLASFWRRRVLIWWQRRLQLDSSKKRLLALITEKDK